MDKPAGYVDTTYLDMMKRRLQEDKQRTYATLGLAPGASVLDVRCGPATDTIALAELVGADGSVTGIDLDPAMVEQANQRAHAAGLSERVVHEVADATDLPFADNTFDGARSERLFQHLSNASAVLEEMVRVTRVGGRVVVFDMDWGNLSIDSPEIETERRLVRFKADRIHVNGFAGRQLYRLFRKARLIDVQVEPRHVVIHDLELFRRSVRLDDIEAEALEAEVITPDALERWRAGLERNDADGAFFASGTLMPVSGSKA